MSNTKPEPSPVTYLVYLDPRADRDLEVLQASDRRRVDKAIAALSSDARPRGSEKLTNQEYYRIRVGDWRVLYLIDDAQKRVLVSRVRRRSERTYR